MLKLSTYISIYLIFIYPDIWYSYIWIYLIFIYLDILLVWFQDTIRHLWLTAWRRSKICWKYPDIWKSKWVDLESVGKSQLWEYPCAADDNVVMIKINQYFDRQVLSLHFNTQCTVTALLNSSWAIFFMFAGCDDQLALEPSIVASCNDFEPFWTLDWSSFSDGEMTNQRERELVFYQISMYWVWRKGVFLNIADIC